MDSPHTLVQSPRKADAPARAPITARRAGAPEDRELVLDRYRLLERLGSGGFGVVWRAHDELLHREVAVKRLWLGPDGDSERAEREALVAARLSHPAIVALYEACAVDDAFYLISELIEGDTLARLIAEQALEDDEVLEIALALVDALVHAHARGVIHRDIKPQNVLVPEPAQGENAPAAMLPAAKLTDFGGASLIGEDALTRTGDVLGTLAYMAPEQSEGREVSEQADLYSLALVTYEALSGQNPVRGATPAATVRRIGRRLAPLHSRRRDLPPALTRAIDRALSPAPAERGTLEQLRLELQEALQHGRTRTRWSPIRSPGLRRAASEESRSDAPRAHRPRTAADTFLRTRAAAAPPALDAHDGAPAADSPAAPPSRFALPRSAWLVAGCALIAWQAISGRPGAALIALAALAPVAVMPVERVSGRLGAGWLACVLAPLLGLLGLAGAYPAIAGQASRWRQRACLGALGYWWLVLAEPLADSRTLGRLWLGQPSGTPSRAAWEGSLSVAATHVVSPLLVLGVLLGALLWGVGAALLPWLVRGRSAALDLIAVTVWSAALAAFAPVLDAGLGAHAQDPSPRGAVLGALLGGVIALAARALRGPV